jgi:hypothetical protein
MNSQHVLRELKLRQAYWLAWLWPRRQVAKQALVSSAFGRWHQLPACQLRATQLLRRRYSRHQERYLFQCLFNPWLRDTVNVHEAVFSQSG